jgi:Uncharacterized protein conserved in bacteria (DUF2272)
MRTALIHGLISALIFFSLVTIAPPAFGQTVQETIAAKAIYEWESFHTPPVVVKNAADATKLSENPLEYGQCKKINVYWQSVKKPPLGDSCLLKKEANGFWDEHPWSAVFVSYILKESGAQKQFKYSSSHSTYISNAMHNRDINNAFQGYPINQVKPEIGDLICAPRKESIKMKYSQIPKKGGFSSHCDIVVATTSEGLEVIGGNVGDSVARTIVALNSDGYLVVTEPNYRPWFIVIKNSL